MTFRETPQTVLGLDIGVATVKLVEIFSRGHRRELSTYAAAARPEESKIPEMKQHLEELLERAHASADAVAIAIPSEYTFSAVVSLPNTPPEQRADAIQAKAKNSIPVSLSNVTLSWAERQRENGIIDVHITAVPKQLVAWYKKLVGQLNLELVALEPEAFPLQRAHDITSERGVLIGNIGVESVTLHIVTQHMPRASRTFALSVADIGKAGSAAARQLQQEIRYFIAAHNVNRAILVGEGALATGIPEAVHGVLGFAAEISHAWHGLVYPAGLEDSLNELGPVLAAAIGCACQPVDHRVNAHAG